MHQSNAKSFLCFLKITYPKHITSYHMCSESAIVASPWSSNRPQAPLESLHIKTIENIKKYKHDVKACLNILKYHVWSAKVVNIQTRTSTCVHDKTLAESYIYSHAMPACLHAITHPVGCNGFQRRNLPSIIDFDFGLLSPIIIEIVAPTTNNYEQAHPVHNLFGVDHRRCPC